MFLIRYVTKLEKKCCFNTSKRFITEYVEESRTIPKVFYSKFTFKNIKHEDIKNVSNREMLFYYGYCSKHKLFTVENINGFMKELEIKVIESINNITVDPNVNKKSILDSRSYTSENKKKPPYFDIHDLVKVYLNICYIHSYLILEQKKKKKKKKEMNGVKEENEYCISRQVQKRETIFEKTECVETSEAMKIQENIRNEEIPREACTYIENIFNLLSIFFLQNVGLLKDHYLCRIFYGYNKSKFYNERFFTNLTLEIIKRIKKIRAYHIYLLLMNCHYLRQVDPMFLKVLLIHLISIFSKLPCEAMCKILPLVNQYVRSEKNTYRINIIYSKKVSSFIQLSQIVKLFKKMIQFDFISQKNLLITLKHMNKFLHIKKKKKYNQKRIQGEMQNKIKGCVEENEVIDKVIQNFEDFEYATKTERKNDLLRKPKEGQESLLVHDEYPLINNEIMFDLKLIHMYLKHNLKNIYSLLPIEYKNFFTKIGKSDVILHKNLQGEREIYILKKYLHLLNYKFITFFYGPYILHIYDIFHKTYVQWKDSWKLSPPYLQNEQMNFETNKLVHLEKEGFTVIFICHDTLNKFETEKEKLNYVDSILKEAKFPKNHMCTNQKMIDPTRVSPIYI